ncbi:hypothetical protein G3545_07915 [Starkeya sp. ORNL1]|uniref:hypothetical protein n=1 Tax=Starkeya sp. ORNL1 TaxID=2709380 RepID=UPI0014649660|nr:hypothetical protein [Starkeya sp. ORNL1]QJP13589.1 hypothetical protein G3545_07915 [Starkeya sp. ORNL1]
MESDATTFIPDTAVTPARDGKRTAVVLIHGMGEQWPMETLRGFADAAWTKDPELIPEGQTQIYSTPDRITGSFELRRITTRYWSGEKRRRVDFFEFYWAHMMQGNTLGAVIGWLKRLLVRSPSRVPARLKAGWIVGLILSLIIGVFVLITALKLWDLVGWPSFILSAIVAAASLLATVWIVPVLGDAARYLSPAPGNVAARQAIREAGIDLITKLHTSGQYDRIILAGHSLGSVIGYDILNHAWGRLHSEDLLAGHGKHSRAMQLLTLLEEITPTLNKDAPDGLSDYRELQRAYFAELSKMKNKAGEPLWLVSDFVTMGCPLSKADVLLGKDEADLEARKALREAPTVPPFLERKKPPRFSYPPDADTRTPHHGAVFAPTVWTNIYYPSALGLFGDFISGPVASLLGAGVRDIRVPMGTPRFRHLSYWTAPEKAGPAIRALRRALNLRGHDEATLWGAAADFNPVDAETLGERIIPEPAAPVAEPVPESPVVDYPAPLIAPASPGPPRP